MSAEDPFEVLGLAPTATTDEIRAAYRGLLKKHKPERDPEGFRRIREAFESANVSAPRNVGAREAQRTPLEMNLSEMPLNAPAPERNAPALGSPEARDEAKAKPLDAGGTRFAMPVQRDSYNEAFDELEQRYHDLYYDPIKAARLVLAALGKFDDDVLSDLLFPAFEEISDPRDRRSMLTPYVGDNRRIIKSLILSFAPSLFSFDQLAALELELDDFDLLSVMVEWARRGHFHLATKLAESLAQKAGRALHPNVISISLVSLGLELLAAGRIDDAIRVRDRLREVDLVRTPGSTPWSSFELMQFRALIAKRELIGDAGIRYLAHAALDPEAVREAEAVPKLVLARRDALVDDAALAALVPKDSEHHQARMPPESTEVVIGGFTKTVSFVAMIIILRLAWGLADCGRSRSHVPRGLPRPPFEVHAPIVEVPMSSEDFDRNEPDFVDGSIDTYSNPLGNDVEATASDGGTAP